MLSDKAMFRKILHSVVIASTLAVASSAFAIDLVSTQGQEKQLGPIVESSDWTLVMLWAHDCVPCERQKPMIEKFYTDSFKRGVSVVGVSTDPASLRAKAEQVYRSTRTSFDNYYYQGSDFSSEFTAYTGQRFLGTPTYMLYDPSGTLKGVHTGAVTRNMLDQQFKPMLKDRVFTPSVDIMR